MVEPTACIPSKTEKLRLGAAGSPYATTSAHPPEPESLRPVPTCTFAVVYVPGPAAPTIPVTSTKPWYCVEASSTCEAVSGR